MIDTKCGKKYAVTKPLTALYAEELLDELEYPASKENQELTLDLSAIEEADIAGINLLVKINLLTLRHHSKLLILLTKDSPLDELLYLTKFNERIMLVYTGRR
ncbi:MAG: hypothetical protein JO154_10355 [Chitinophaga sp.]|uniref:hypothetical protein n=1 Tax=Chitinophaga sp. TaxID=1869181 RepID=UPI0025C2C6C4|nr:hypothetical protein [Chitinophaga sp.]MBV8252996.1 hypothetical protein [Chitinophaga sp.]